MSTRKHSKITFVALMIAFWSGFVAGQEWRQVLDLEGTWRFEIGDDPSYAAPEFDDSGWELIHVPSAWEQQGFPGYDGFAWYRKQFVVPTRAGDHLLYVELGHIDDVDEVYLNGRLIGYEGQFPPVYRTAYQFYRRYLLPPEFLRHDGKNTLAVRVFDETLAGGIIRGNVGVFERSDEIELAYHFDQTWKLRTGDNVEWAKPETDDSNWQTVAVPSYWDAFGNLKEYDGFGWYRLRFDLPASLEGERLILFLGKIDDVDETYLNGKRIGKTGPFPRTYERAQYYGDHYNEYRAYTIPSNLLKFGSENVIAVRVYDALIHGGIWDGPVGLATRQQFMAWDHGKDPVGSLIRWLIGVF